MSVFFGWYNCSYKHFKFSSKIYAYLCFCVRLIQTPCLSLVGPLGLTFQSPSLKQKKSDFLSEKSNKAFPIIGVGGIHKPEDALEKLEAGASLVQLYTGFIYEGPKLISDINTAILKKNVVL